MLEIACFNTSSAIEAAKRGADRIELCADYTAGGITPPHDSLQLIRRETNIPINVMIRPRGGDFIYNDAEFSQMKSDIQVFKTEASGFVFGILDEHNRVDQARNKELVELAAPLPCTFHRAFDLVDDPFAATKDVIECGFTSILTSGGEATAVAGAGVVAELQRKFGGKISFILGGGVRSSNIEALKQRTDVEWFHSAAITLPGENVDGEEVGRMQELLNGNNNDKEFGT